MPAATDSRPPALFVGLFPDGKALQAIEAHRAAWWWTRPAARRQPRAHRLHLTLAHLGPRDDSAIDGLRGALQSVRMEPFDLHLDRAEVWTRNGVAVLRPAPSEALARLHRRIAAALGLAAPAGWQPHLTLARDAWESAAPPVEPPIAWPVREFVLVRSWLPPHPARHEVLLRRPLDGP
ncbi:2'-5' RNA ligase family protein [Xenophilus sp.]|uniref:2'-5' RNA ligase family protein n=2 Tax=Xenophilus sp. TaxID=1873499 RepID=UPI0037DC4C93